MDIGPDPEVHHHHHTGTRWFDMILAISAVVISMFTAAMALQNGKAMEKMVDQNARMVQASTWPYILIGDQSRNETGGRIYKLTIYNNGVGPAKVQSLKLTYKGREVSDYTKLAALVANDTGYVGKRSIGESEGVTVIPARQNVPILLVEPPISDPGLVQAFLKSRDQITASACYCSIFDECWTVDNVSANPKPVKQCKASGPVTH